MCGATEMLGYMGIHELRTFTALNNALGAPPLEHVRLVGRGAGIDEQRCWGGPLVIDDLAVASIAHAVGLIAVCGALRVGRPLSDVTIDPVHAAASFRYESFVEPVGWSLPSVWDDLFGDYRCADGWIRIHTNYVHHRHSVLRALGLPVDATRPAVEQAFEGRSAWDAERAIAAASGVAARQRTRSEWTSAPEGIAVAATPPLWENSIAEGAENGPFRAPTSGPGITKAPSSARSTVATDAPDAPLDGIRVVDLTRVLAGPTATGVLAAWGAEVTRIDPPGFEEVPAIVPITTHGKRCIRLDLAAASGRADLQQLLVDADVVVHGYRPGALAAAGIDLAKAHRRNPGLVEVSLSAFGPGHPLSSRRGFDSIVQNAVGITDLGAQLAAADRPSSMPCQALDHAAGWIMASAVANGLIRRESTGAGGSWSTSLAGVAELLWRSSSDPENRWPSSATSAPFGANIEMSDLDEWLATTDTPWGPLRRLTWPGAIGGVAPSFGVENLGADNLVPNR